MALNQSMLTAWYRDNKEIEDQLLSGSICEGFRFISSDWDWMFILRKFRVTFSLPTEDQFHNGHILLLAERYMTKPGFALLRLFNHLSDPVMAHLCVQHRDGYYLASQKWRDSCTSLLSYLTTHGPCSTSVAGITEIDFAHCFKSDILPDESHCFIYRLHRAGWPSTSTLQKIVSGGCHFVAIGAKQSPAELMEWRISFSVAEKTLIHSMNHVQFLCYGLLKIFLKEAIEVNVEIKGLLCSYFLKTALFWEISTSLIQWNASNFLSCFWTCFQRLLHWINNEYCPNFFIPENNMFAGKIQGEARSRLLSYLVPLYQEGYNCLLRCTSIYSGLYTIIQRPLLATMIETTEESEKCTVEVQLILEVWNSKPDYQTVRSYVTKQVQDLDHIMFTSDTDFEQEILQIWRNYLIQNCYILSCIGEFFTVDNVAQQSRQFSLTAMPVFDATRHLLYTALYHYRRGVYNEAISLLQDAKIKLQHPHLMYPQDSDVKKYRAAGGEHKPFTQMMKEIVSWPVALRSNVTIPELTLEHQSAANHSLDHITVPPLVFTDFMSFLCYHHMEMASEAGALLQGLSILVHYDDGHHIPKVFTAISWQMLGICHEMSGDHQGAYQSYCNALRQTWCEIGQASLVRMKNLIR